MQSTHTLSVLAASLALCAGASAQSADVTSVAAPGSAPTPIVFNGAINGSLLHDNGPFITGIGNGAGGADTSEIEAGFNTFGYGTQQTIPIRIADDFDVPSGDTWALASMTWRGYQTGSSTAGSITAATVRIWDGPPASGGSVIAGDDTTNRLIGQVWSGVYRVTSTTLTNTQRPIMDIEIDMSWAPDLMGGNYWVDVGLAGSLASGPWSNPTVPSQPTDNAQQFQTATGWVMIIDATANAGQDFPFTLDGLSTGGCMPNISTYCTAKVTSNGCVPAIGSTGTPSPIGAFALTCDNVEVNQLGAAVYSLAGPASSPFLGGTLCIQTPNVIRTPIQSSGGLALCTGTYVHDMTGAIVSPPPSTQFWAQFWFRDSGDMQGTGLSDGITFTTCP